MQRKARKQSCQPQYPPLRGRFRKDRLLTSIYSVPCPTCKAPAWHRCVSERGVRHSAHSARIVRSGVSATDSSLISWWREMARYEGKHPAKRPAWLEVPTSDSLQAGQ